MIDTDPFVGEESQPPEPVDPRYDHRTDGTPCWCMPRVEALPCGSELVIHNDVEDWS